MKKTHLIAGIGVLLIAVLLIWLLTRGSDAPPTTPPVVEKQATKIDPAPSVTASPPEAPDNQQGRVGLDDPRWEWWNQMKETDPSFEWKMPINFYGRVIDQDDQPIEGAQIKFSWTDTTGNSKHQTISDGEGFFELRNRTGKVLTVRVEKEGYLTLGSKGGAGFEYAAFFEGHYHTPDLDNPVIFRLEKELEAEPLIRHRQSTRLSYDEGSYFYDLETGRISQQQATNRPGLRLTMIRSQSAQGQPFDWTWQVQGVNAVIQSTEEQFPQLAPQNGYTNQWQLSKTANSDTFQKHGKVRLYINTANGKFGRADLELGHPNQRDLGPRIVIESYLNPSGSNILAYDSSLAIKP